MLPAFPSSCPKLPSQNYLTLGPEDNAQVVIVVDGQMMIYSTRAGKRSSYHYLISHTPISNPGYQIRKDMHERDAARSPVRTLSSTQHCHLLLYQSTSTYSSYLLKQIQLQNACRAFGPSVASNYAIFQSSSGALSPLSPGRRRGRDCERTSRNRKTPAQHAR